MHKSVVVSEMEVNTNPAKTELSKLISISKFYVDSTDMADLKIDIKSTSIVRSMSH